MKLPVSGLELQFQVPDGNDDLAILEAAGAPLERALVALSRLAVVEEIEDARPRSERANRRETAEFWAGLTVTDFESALLGLRQFLSGDKVACVFRDRQHKCGVRMELEFSITNLLDEVRVGSPRDVRPSDDSGWFVLSEGDSGEIRFRLPTVGDQLQAMNSADGASLLARKCIEVKGGGRTAPALGRAERAMERMAPPVSRPLAGNCPECGEPLTMALHVPRLVIDELANQAATVYEEMDSIAAVYHWDEAAILSMPQGRRRRYANAIRSREQAAV